MKKIVKKLLLTSLLFSAAIIPAKTHASFFNWATLSNGIAKIGNKTANLLITNSSKAFDFLKNHPIAAGATALGIVFGLYKLRSNRQPKQLNHAHLEARDNLEEIQPKLTFLQMIKNNQVKEVEQALLKEEADVNQDENGNPPLIVAVSLENIELATLLIEHNANVNRQDRYGHTALMEAVSLKNIELATLLIEHNANVNLQDFKNRTALMRAAERENIKLATLLIEHNADVSRQDRYGRTALMRAAERGNEKLATLLIEHNADVNRQDHFGQTALMEATKINNKNVVKLLLENGANPDAQAFLHPVTAYDLGDSGIKNIIATFKRQELQKIPILNDLLPTDLVKLTADFTY
ncbi:MAG: ankyrin repeat domain-containing protein [Candidatus Babeliales bacterium]